MRATAGPCLLLTGCLYLDPFNKPPVVRPSCELADGRQCGNDADVHRGDRMRIQMIVTDPDDNQDESTYAWKATGCTGDGGTGCAKQPYDAQHYDEAHGLGVELEIPATLPADVRSISLDFEAHDDRGGVGAVSLVFHVTAAMASSP